MVKLTYDNIKRLLNKKTFKKIKNGTNVIIIGGISETTFLKNIKQNDYNKIIKELGGFPESQASYYKGFTGKITNVYKENSTYNVRFDNGIQISVKKGEIMRLDAHIISGRYKGGLGKILDVYSDNTVFMSIIYHGKIINVKIPLKYIQLDKNLELDRDLVMITKGEYRGKLGEVVQYLPNFIAEIAVKGAKENIRLGITEYNPNIDDYNITFIENEIINEDERKEKEDNEPDQDESDYNENDYYEKDVNEMEDGDTFMTSYTDSFSQIQKTLTKRESEFLKILNKLLIFLKIEPVINVLDWEYILYLWENSINDLLIKHNQKNMSEHYRLLILMILLYNYLTTTDNQEILEVLNGEKIKLDQWIVRLVKRKYIFTKISLENAKKQTLKVFELLGLKVIPFKNFQQNLTSSSNIEYIPNLKNKKDIMKSLDIKVRPVQDFQSRSFINKDPYFDMNIGFLLSTRKRKFVELPKLGVEDITKRIKMSSSSNNNELLYNKTLKMLKEILPEDILNKEEYVNNNIQQIYIKVNEILQTHFDEMNKFLKENQMKEMDINRQDEISESIYNYVEEYLMKYLNISDISRYHFYIPINVLIDKTLNILNNILPQNNFLSVQERIQNVNSLGSLIYDNVNKMLEEEFNKLPKNERRYNNKIKEIHQLIQKYLENYTFDSKMEEITSSLENISITGNFVDESKELTEELIYDILDKKDSSINSIYQERFNLDELIGKNKISKVQYDNLIKKLDIKKTQLFFIIDELINDYKTDISKKIDKLNVNEKEVIINLIGDLKYEFKILIRDAYTMLNKNDPIDQEFVTDISTKIRDALDSLIRDDSKQNKKREIFNSLINETIKEFENLTSQDKNKKKYQRIIDILPYSLNSIPNFQNYYKYIKSNIFNILKKENEKEVQVFVNGKIKTKYPPKSKDLDESIKKLTEQEFYLVKKIRNEIMKETNKRYTEWEESQLFGEDVEFSSDFIKNLIKQGSDQIEINNSDESLDILNNLHSMNKEKIFESILYRLFQSENYSEFYNFLSGMTDKKVSFSNNNYEIIKIFLNDLYENIIKNDFSMSTDELMSITFGQENITKIPINKYMNVKEIIEEFYEDVSEHQNESEEEQNEKILSEKNDNEEDSSEKEDEDLIDQYDDMDIDMDEDTPIKNKGKQRAF
jgi:hypothetical protein